ncbi:hypothetical protein BON30_19195 [Cystobacter ferrugineus]|uniref:Ig-like domain-containing protein n=2 Tax=Cystobacter ferrugineus TaxID=83449 RepID=A0A1L9BBH3_9BACT|nr:hypothetical protein BON30_19195 [Cystobacter ferrugineus]
MLGAWLALFPGTGAFAAEPVNPWAHLVPSDTAVTCFGSNRTVYSPPISSVPQRGSMSHSSHYSCLTLVGPAVSSAAVAATSVDYPSYTCDMVLGSAPERFTVIWNNGEHSELSLASAEVDVQATTTTVTYSGEVVAGKFKGQGAVRSWSFRNEDLWERCLSPEGLPEANVFTILVLTRLPTPAP